MPKTAARRTLTFATLDQVMADVDRLLERGHTTVGRWTLAQVCNHLSRSTVLAVEGTSHRLPWVVRALVGPFVFRRIVKTGRMPEGVKGPAYLAPGDDLDARAEAEALRAAIRLFGMHTGEYAPHPVFGRLSREQTERLLCIHCAHHLSFVRPAESALSEARGAGPAFQACPHELH